jgi:hypothetical protein
LRLGAGYDVWRAAKVISAFDGFPAVAASTQNSPMLPLQSGCTRWLGVFMLVCVALALRPSPDPGDQLPVDVAPLHDGASPDAMASAESELVSSIELVAGGDAMLGERKFEAARQLFEKAYVVRQTLHQLAPEDARRATAVLVVEARLARVSCLEGDATAAAKHIQAALDMLRGSAGLVSKERRDLESWLIAVRTRYQRGSC